MLASEKMKLLKLEEILSRRVVGQQQAIMAVSDAIRRNKSGLSDAVVGASTDFAFGADRNLVLTPSVYYQWSLEKTVNPDNEFWVSVGLKYAF